ncbi:hypothetical protein NEAUS03_1784 [Nematocida ausubeli]|nr:hypothetical protein NEAUS03_1784 [Nematocida ausubeli]
MVERDPGSFPQTHEGSAHGGEGRACSAPPPCLHTNAGASRQDGAPGCGAPVERLSPPSQLPLPASGHLPSSSVQLSLPLSWRSSLFAQLLRSSSSAAQAPCSSATQLALPPPGQAAPAQQPPGACAPPREAEPAAAPSAAALLELLRARYGRESFTLRTARLSLFRSAARPSVAALAGRVEELLQTGGLALERTVRGCRYLYCRAADGLGDGPVERAAARLYARLCRLFLRRGRRSFNISAVRRGLFTRGSMPSRADLLAWLDALVRTRKLRLSVGPRRCSLYSFDAGDQ